MFLPLVCIRTRCSIFVAVVAFGERDRLDQTSWQRDFVQRLRTRTTQERKDRGKRNLQRKQIRVRMQQMLDTKKLFRQSRGSLSPSFADFLSSNVLFVRLYGLQFCVHEKIMLNFIRHCFPAGEDFFSSSIKGALNFLRACSVGSSSRCSSLH